MRGMAHGIEACTSMPFNNFRDTHKAASPLTLPTRSMPTRTKPKNISFSHSYPHPNSPLPISSNVTTIAAAAAASSSSASFPVPADFPSPTEADKSLDPKRQKKKNRIAGVDQDDLLDPTLLADPDSNFCEFKGVQIHHKLYQPHHAHQPLHTSSSSHAAYPSSNLGFPIILLHGFGASLFSWSRVMKPLARLTNSKVLAFDRPAFGLTSRPHLSDPVAQDTVPLNPYSMAFSVLATLYFIDSLAADKAVLVGHSAGSLVAVNTYFEAPERVAALILIAPAIFAPIAFQKVSEGGNMGKDRQTKNTNTIGKSFVKLLMILAKSVGYIAQAIMAMVKGMLNMVNSLYKKILSSILRSTLGAMLIRVVIDKFGVAAVRNAWYDANKLSEDVIAGYTKPLRAKGWDKALAEFTAATLASTESEAKPYFAERLREISCPVLIITGDNDRLVPSWNARRLSQTIPGSSFEEIKHCGHLPHEEKVEEFLSAVEKFLRKAFSDSEELSVQPAL